MDAREEIGEQLSTGVEIRAQKLPFPGTHRVQALDRGADRLFDARHHGVLDRRFFGPFTHGHGLRKSQQVAGGHRPFDLAAVAGPLKRGAERFEQRFVEVHLERRRAPLLHRHGHLDAPARYPLLDDGANASVEAGECRRRPDLQVEETMIDGFHRHRDGRRFVVVRERRVAGHALDH